MILNHKAAIDYLVHAPSVAVDTRTVIALHALLSDGLMRDAAASGRIRRRVVEVSGSVYHPLGLPQRLEELFEIVLRMAAEIDDPFEQSFFLMVHLPYLQPFEDVNKRTSRLAANIPLARHNLAPLSFVDVPPQAYIDGLLGVYETTRVDLLRDVFVWAYERSCQQYTAVKQQLVVPDTFRLRLRPQLAAAIQKIMPHRIRVGRSHVEARHPRRRRPQGPRTLRSAAAVGVPDAARRQRRAFRLAAFGIRGVAGAALGIRARAKNDESKAIEMTLPSIVETFVTLVETGHGVEAVERFYADHATMRENQGAPRVGKPALIAFEHAAQASVTNLRSSCKRPILIDGDIVVIRWVFEYTVRATGKAVRFEELAWQRWEGDLIVEEQFFYDPAQTR